MGVDRESDDDSRELLDALTAEECRETARFIRDSAPRLPTANQRRIAERAARRFDARALELERQQRE